MGYFDFISVISFEIKCWLNNLKMLNKPINVYKNINDFYSEILQQKKQ